jgi:hypothetical protein
MNTYYSNWRFCLSHIRASEIFSSRHTRGYHPENGHTRGLFIGILFELVSKLFGGRERVEEMVNLASWKI